MCPPLADLGEAAPPERRRRDGARFALARDSAISLYRAARGRATGQADGGPVISRHFAQQSSEQSIATEASQLELIVDNLAVERGGRIVISELSFAVKRGEVLLLTGPNGIGKTTLLRTLAGYIAPVEGSARAAGVDSDERRPAEDLHYLGHLNGIRSSLTVAENARFWAGFLAGAAASDSLARVDEALERFGLDALADVPAAWLSAGQKRRLGLTRLLLAPRPVWLLDEPTTSLDAASTTLLVQIINNHTAAGGLAVIATHAPLELERARELRLGARATS
jgi:heme exporter protein A